jgi:hypothetical protein
MHVETLQPFGIGSAGRYDTPLFSYIKSRSKHNCEN